MNDRGGGTSYFPVKHVSYIQDAKNFSVVKPLNSGEALASPVPPPLMNDNDFHYDYNPPCKNLERDQQLGA